MEKIYSLLQKLLMLWISLILLNCGTARRSVPLRGELDAQSEEIAMGQKVFMNYCQACHPHGEAGLGLAINDKPLPGFLIRFQVRNGLGVMPSFKEDVISDEELGQIVAYLKALRKNDG
jgi:mono/diheme cytochrome c family protein